MKYFISLVSLLMIFGCSETPSDIPIGSFSDVEAIVTFSVRMSYQIELGNFDSTSDLYNLYIVGDFNDDGEWEDHLMEIDDMDDYIYKISFTNFGIGNIIEFKFWPIWLQSFQKYFICFPLKDRIKGFLIFY